MKATQKLQDIGQSLWLDNIPRGPLANGTLRRSAGAYPSEVASKGIVFLDGK